MKKVAVILAGCGVFDGSEIQESVFSLLALDQEQLAAHCFAPNKNQFHVLNHCTGDEMEETRNVLIESARIARGEIGDLKALQHTDYDALLIPGGFGAAKNLNQWAMKGPDGEIDADVKQTILDFVTAKKPVVGLCMAPTVIAQALHNSNFQPQLTVGSTEEKSPYDIGGISAGMESLGAKSAMKTANEIEVDRDLKIITAPCYMMEASIATVFSNVQLAVKELKNLLEA